MRYLAMLSFVLLAGCQSVAGAGAMPEGFGPVHFLPGCWQTGGSGRSTLEVWTPPYGDAMYGQNRELRSGALAFFELLTIERRGDSLVYVARPSGGAATEFAMTAHDQRSVTFENPQHDFPKRIRYELRQDGQLAATVDDGTDEGQRVSFVWRRVTDRR